MRAEMDTLRQLVPLAAGTLIRYSFRHSAGTRVIVGRKGQPLNPGYNAGFEILDDAGEVVARISRHSWVEVL